MELSARGQAFMDSLDPDSLKVSDGKDGLPVWVGIDAEAGRVYKVYASGLATGFGDVRLDTINGLRNGQRGSQSTRGRHVFTEVGVGTEADWKGVIYTADPGPTFKSEADPVLFEIRLPTGEVAKLTLHGNFEGLPAGSQVTNLALPLWFALIGEVRSKGG